MTDLIESKQARDRNRFLLTLVICLNILVAGFILLLIFWSVYPYRPIQFKNLPYKVKNKVIKAGGVLEYTSDYCKYTNEIPSTIRSFVNDIIYNLPVGQATKKPIGCAKSTFILLVPKELPPSIYILKTTYTYKVNPIRNIVVTNDTEKFEVVK